MFIYLEVYVLYKKNTQRITTSSDIGKSTDLCKIVRKIISHSKMKIQFK